MRYIQKSVDLNDMGKVDLLPGSLFQGEDMAHTFLISARRGAEAAPLSGVVTAVFDQITHGLSIPLSGSVEDGAVQVTLSEGCYMPGCFALTIYLEENGVQTALYQARGFISHAGGGASYDPDSLLPNLPALVKEVKDAIASVPTDYAHLLGTIAPDYTGLSYPVSAGRLCWHAGTLYRAKQDIPSSESWTAAHWEEAVLGEDVAAVKDTADALDSRYALGKNLVNPDEVLAGKYAGVNGAVSTNASYCLSGLIPVEEGKTYAFDNARFLTAYNAKRQAVSASGSSSALTSYTVPAGIAYIRLSFYASGAPFMANEGSALAAYEPYKVSLKNGFNTVDCAEVKRVTGDVLAVYQTVSATIGSAATVKVAEGEQYKKRTLIAILHQEDLTGSAIFINYRTASSGRVLFANGKAKCTFSATGDIYISTSTGTSYNGDICFIDVTGKEGLAEYLMALSGSAILQLVGKPVNGLIPLKTSQLVNDSGFITSEQKDDAVYSRFGVGEIAAEADTAAANNTITIIGFPHYLNKDFSITFYGKFDSFSSLKIGLGYQTYRGRWIEIDGTNFVIKQCSEAGTETTMATHAHGLTFSQFIAVTITVDDDGGERYAVNTLSGAYTCASSSYWHNGVLFATAGQAMTAVAFKGVASGLKKPMWAMGDSYLGFENIRVMGQLRALGFTKGLCVDAQSGLAPDAAYDELVRMLALGTPKYLLWTLGMNHNGTFTSVLSQLSALCETKGIELILYLCPSVPGKDRSSFRTAVLATGLRYIDANLAVGASNDGSAWYTGYLSEDNVHPTELGAKALAMRFLVDVPEIMQFVNDG